MKNLLKLAAVLLMFISMLTANAQVYNYEDGEEPPLPADSIKGLFIGFNIGFYQANKNTGVIYDGRGYERDGVLISTFSESWLNHAIYGPPVTNENRTSEAMRAAPGEWIFAADDMPGEMRFRPSFLFGGHLRYMINADFGFILEANGTFPVTVGQFTIQRMATSPDPLQNQRLERFSIRGKEQRLMINLGLHRVMGRKSVEYEGREPKILPYFDLGATVLFTKFQENLIDLGEYVVHHTRIVDLTQFYHRTGARVDEANLLTGVGFGGFASLGMQITLSRKFTIDMGYVANMQQVKLGELNKLGLQHQILIKVIYM